MIYFCTLPCLCTGVGLFPTRFLFFGLNTSFKSPPNLPSTHTNSNFRIFTTMTTDGRSIFISFEKHRSHRETISFSTSFKSQWSGIIHYFQMDGISRNEWALSCMLYNPGTLQLCAHESAQRENTTTTTKKTTLQPLLFHLLGLGFELWPLVRCITFHPFVSLLTS